MKKAILIIGWLIVLINFSFAQTAPGIEWQNTIGGSLSDALISISQTTDGGYICGGHSISNISGDKTETCLGNEDYWVVKLDSAGNIQWQNTIGGNSYDYMSSITQTSDGGYICGGYSSSNISGDKTENSLGGYDYWIVKLDSSGNLQWQNTIGGNNTDLLRCISQTLDGGYVCGGRSNSNISGDKTENCWNSSYDYWVIKLDSFGNIQWQNTIGGTDYDELWSICQTVNGEYFCAGASSSNISGDKIENSLGGPDYWIVTLDSFGNIQWQNTIGGDDSDEPTSIYQTNDGGYILGGYSRSNISGDKTENCLGYWDYWIVKLNSMGLIQWQNTIGGDNTDFLLSIAQTANGNYVCGGCSLSNISGDKTENSLGSWDYWVLKLDDVGNIQWQNTIGGSHFDFLNSIVETIDGGFICGGHSSSNISGDKAENCLGGYDYWIVKLAPDTMTGITQHLNQISNIQISPNPFASILTVKETTQKGELIIFDVTGKEILRTKTFGEETKINTAHLTPGFYFINYREENKTINKKVVKF